MQPALTPEVLVPAGAGAVLLLLTLAAVLAVRHRRRAQARRAVADRGAEGPAEHVAAGHTPAGRSPAEDVPDGVEPDRSESGPADRSESGPAERVESGRTVAAAVAQALAVRAVRARVAAISPEGTAGGHDGTAQTDEPRPAVPAPASSTEAGPSAAPDGATWQEPAAAPRGRGDARDRLLAVLLDDPVHAVGAAEELEACRRQLARLADAVGHERHTLGSVLARLSEAGLAPDQLARLSGLSDEELRSLLPTRVSAGG